jgi:hypothetical protein
MPERFAPDYIQVNERIAAFKATYPEGSLQSEIITLTENLVVVKAYAYRHPDDQRPGIGHSSLTIPGATPYTRGSELENAETSAYGRALAALGFEVKRAVATAEEVRAKRGAAKPKAEGYRRDELVELARAKGLDLDGIESYAALVGIAKGTPATEKQMDALIEAIAGHGTEQPMLLPDEFANLPEIPM